MKTYCISDVHGHYGNLERMMKHLERDDRVFVLGDVVDKGEASMKCLLAIMRDERFTMLMGNHEYMMWQLLSSPEGSEDYKLAFVQWVLLNYGQRTLDEYRELGEEEREEIFRYIENLPLNLPDVEVNGRSFYLVHSCPGEDRQVDMEALDHDEMKIIGYIWERYEGQIVLDERTIVGGHTFVQAFVGTKEKVKPYCFGDRIKDAKYINIDGGLATGLPEARLICLCLDDLSYRTY